jgi:hypothetical protein
MTSNRVQYEKRVQQACEDKLNHKYDSAAQAARANDVPPSTVRHRLIGRAPTLDIYLDAARLSLV